MRIDATSPVGISPRDYQRADEAAKAFEAQMLTEMLAPLFNSAMTPEIAGGGKSEQQFRAMLQEHYAKAIAARGGLGIADAVKAALIDMQSRQNEGPTP
jgi:Rod binding domain-containing protein